MGFNIPMAKVTPGIASWRNQPLGITILRLWLGGTWVYGGWVKASDGAFLRKSGANSFSGQLTGYIGHSPLTFILRHMLEHATLVAWFVMLSEFAIGIAILAGVAMQLAIFGGFSVSIILWLSVTYHVRPYFLGSDLAFAASWLALFFLWQAHVKSGTRARSGALGGLIPNLRDRREVMGILGVGAGAIIASLAGGAFRPKPKKSALIVKAADFPVGSTMPFTANDGNPAILFRTKAGVFAYSAVCTHQGCTVAYDALSHSMNCPCHGAKFDSTSGAVLAGPAQTPLPKISVAISGANIVQM
jgi:thiosulfate dehydrogenase [quinone] large subunit